ncbi:DNA-directed RNA polymerase subunit beta [Isosphaera pallida ATCC 43644]|uniref:DNA-directed RNA polymerase subunit beta n=1 Tax=Isosphaera pallida (strain ATCC 43644 / DSM 9630 / IS1B) TaxID=575540 RepID=E8R5G1_ISOPI|nr:DNA-directed RNA polymerase subunit beta [Isosphaera pallida]ADV60702.1 DNA-directed RNA polymerase subunit beta [Isosphaera pallida ATCC 43644]
MSTGSTIRRIVPSVKKFFGRIRDDFPIPDLTQIQTESYARFLQEDTPPEQRKDQGLEAVFREIFPIESYGDKTLRLEYIKYELGKPRYDPDECRRLSLTYGRPLNVWLRLWKGDESIEDHVYLGDMPIMIGGGEFIINGAERVVVSQLHRSPGVDFVVDTESGDKKLHACRIIPERGSWIELQVNKKDALEVRIDQSGKFSAMTLLRAMDPAYSTDEAILRAFYDTETIHTSEEGAAARLENKIACGDVVDPETGEVLCDSGARIDRVRAQLFVDHNLGAIEVMVEVKDPLILHSLQMDPTSDHESALLKIYQRLRPGNPPQLDKARDLFREKFYDTNRYRLGRVGRFRINRKFNLDLPEDKMTLDAADYVHAIRYIIDLRRNKGHIDDIDHLGNRRLRTIDELAADEIRKGFLKLRRTVQERMTMKDAEDLNPRSLINQKSISAAIDYFFGRGELSQVVDQTNPLAQLTHERRLSALGPGGLNRKRAGFEVRDVHISHYGRICPIETPEGTNIGLISSLANYARVDEYGFLVCPYRVVENGKPTNEVRWMRADDENDVYLAPADVPLDEHGRIKGPNTIARYQSDIHMIPSDKVQYIDISPRQVVGVSAGLIPFLEHDDANRALMGSNMQRQAVPLLVAEPPLVATGLEGAVAMNSGMVVRAREDGVVTEVDSTKVVIDGVHVYKLRKYIGLNERTCLNQKPVVSVGQQVKKGDLLADGASTYQGELALGRNVLVAFMSWDGYNFEDAIILSERLVKEDVYTSIHIEEFEADIRETKLGREEFTRDIPNVSEKALRHLDENGIVAVGTYVKPGDILVGKVAPKSKSELSPEEKLLHAIFGRSGEDVKNDSLEVPSGVEGIVLSTQRFSRRTSLTEEERKAHDKEIKDTEQAESIKIAEAYRQMIKELEEVIGGPVVHKETARPYGREKDPVALAEESQSFKLEHIDLHGPDILSKAREVHRRHAVRIDNLRDEKERKLNSLKLGDELQTGVLQMVKIYVATKRVISVGDKMAGRHGNKGVIAKILPEEDMPFLADGTPVEILLNPLGVPSRMNVGQILETHLGWAAAKLGFRAICPVFDGADESVIRQHLKEAGLPENGKAQLYDGRTGEPFDQKVTVGYMYMLKLHHLVDDKIHARATGPYSLITQQPLGGKARFGGQRFGEMEVWALEAYGAAYILQELLTVKSDDVEGRTKIYESMVKGENTLEAGTPASFDVLTNEIRGLALNMQLEKKRV